MADQMKVDYKDEGIAHLLADRSFRVPIHQRSYSWDAEQIEDFWNDLSTAMSESDAEYFMGTIVLTAPSRDKERREGIIDGQQRLATTAILLACIRDELMRLGETERAEAINAQYLAKHDIVKNEKLPKLRLNAIDAPFFDDLIIRAKEVEPSAPSHNRILAARSHFLKEVGLLASNAGLQAAQLLADWTEFLAERVKVIAVRVRDEADAYLIFETLNDRGLDLAIADLLKNYLFGKAGAQLESVREAWTTSLGALEATSEDGTFKAFLRHLWSSKHGATRERELFKRMRAALTSQAKAVSFASEMSGAARHYAALLNPHHEAWADLGTTNRKNLETLIRLEIQQHRPLMLAAMDSMEHSELAKLVRKLVSWQLRGLIVGGIGGGTAEKAYCSAALAVRSKKIKKAAEVLKVLDAIVPGDKAFEDAFKGAYVTKGRIARYILLALEHSVTQTSEPELVPNENEDVVTLEHVLPRNPVAKDWKAFSPEERRDFVHRIGNLALRAKGPNKKMGNKSFGEKKAVLAAASFKLTKEIGNESDWTPATIVARQARLAKLAVKLWPR